MNLSLRPYQQEAVNKIRSEYMRGTKRVLLVSPCGSGKTAIFGHIAENSRRLSRKVLVIVHRKNLWMQASTKMDEYGIKHGVIASGQPTNKEPIQIASIDTLNRRLDLIQKPDLFVFDEAHHLIRGNKWSAPLGKFPEAFVLGVTATPCRLSGEGLGSTARGYFESLVKGPEIADLTPEYLCPLKVLLPEPIADVAKIRKLGGDYVRSEVEELLMTSSVRIKVIDNYKKYCDGKLTLIFCSSIAHSEYVADSLSSEGYLAKCVHGKLKTQELIDRLSGFGKTFNILASCDIISEGFDVPGVEAVILLRPTASLGLFRQQVGRAMRPFTGKEYGILLDCVGNVGKITRYGELDIKHGFPDDIIEWSLTDRAVRKKTIDERPDATKMCKQCFAIHAPASVCPYCGYVYEEKPEKKTVDVDVKLTERTRADIINRKREEGMCKTYEELKELARKRGYKPGWAWFRWKARTGKRRVA